MPGDLSMAQWVQRPFGYLPGRNIQTENSLSLTSAQALLATVWLYLLPPVAIALAPYNFRDVM